MKITIISTMEGFSWGGSEELWYGVAKLAIQKGYTVQVCLKKWDSKNDKIDFLIANGVQMVFRKTKQTYYRRIVNKLGHENSFGYISKIRNFAPDFILISQGGTFDFFGHGHLYNYIQKDKVPYSLISQYNSETGGILSEEFRLRVKNTYPWNNFYFVALRNQQTAERQCAITFSNAKFINNLIDFEDLKFSEWPTGDTLQLACVARLECSYKGQDILLETLSDPYFKNKNYLLNLYGTGPDHQHIQALIDHYELNDKVFIKGHTQNKDEIWKNNHILILPSIGEGTPLALQECMLKGRPAITTDVGGCDEFVINEKTGFLCATSSRKILHEALVNVFNTPMEELRKMGIIAQEHISSKLVLNPPAIILEDLEKSFAK